jgi:hypothetical protein
MRVYVASLSLSRALSIYLSLGLLTCGHERLLVPMSRNLMSWSHVIYFFVFVFFCLSIRYMELTYVTIWVCGPHVTGPYVTVTYEFGALRVSRYQQAGFRV